MIKVLVLLAFLSYQVGEAKTEPKATKPTPEQRAAAKAAQVHEQELKKMLRGSEYPVAYAEAVLAERETAIEVAKTNLMAHKKTKPKGGPESRQWHGTLRNLEQKLQYREKWRLARLTTPTNLQPERWNVGDIGCLQYLSVKKVRDSATLEVEVGIATIVGTDNAQRKTTMGGPARTPQPLYGVKF